jgi:signal recognition particle receptor subunit beta
MVSVNPIDREIQLKLVYYGPGLGGKTTTLQHIHKTTDPGRRGKMVSLATPVERTLYFDYLPLRLPPIGGFTLKLQLFTVPGQVHFNATRKLVLSNADGVVFVADSQVSRLDANLESLDNLVSNLESYNLDPDEFPVVYHYNKRDLEEIMTIEALEKALNKRGCPSLGTCALTGENVYQGLELITKEVLRDLKQRDVLARQDRPTPVAPEDKIVFKKTEAGLSSQVQAISERLASTSVSSPPETVEDETTIQTNISVHEDAAHEDAARATADLSDSTSSPAPPFSADRPTIPAPFALTEKVASEKERSQRTRLRGDETGEVRIGDDTDARGEDTAKVFTGADADKKSVSSFTGYKVSPFSFSPLWPESSRSRAIEIEAAVSRGRYKDAIRLVSHELDIIITRQSRGLPKSSAETIIALLGLDGRQYIEITKLAISPETNLSRKAALNAYLFLLQAIDRVG